MDPERLVAVLDTDSEQSREGRAGETAAMTDLVNGHERQRAASRDYLLRRTALEVVDPVNRSIEAWQPRVAVLRALGRNRPLSPLPHAKEIRVLLKLIDRRRRQFERALEHASPELRRHSRVLDTSRALAQLDQALRNASQGS